MYILTGAPHGLLDQESPVGAAERNNNFSLGPETDIERVISMRRKGEARNWITLGAAVTPEAIRR
jgi:hypothetical protein